MFYFKGRTNEVIRPMKRSTWSSNAMWIEMTPQKLVNQTTAQRGGGITIANESDPKFIFLGPNEVMETVSHSWEAYESMASKIAEKLVSAAVFKSQTNALKDMAKLSDVSLKDIIDNPLGQLDTLAVRSGQDIPKRRIDTPLVYTTSERRKWSFMFTLISESGMSDMEAVVHPVQDLMKYSSSETKTSTEIELPYLFNLKTRPSSFIEATYAILESVQPTWKGPYREGVPTSCDLTLNFVDLSPLFRKTLERGSSIINVITR